MAQRLKHLPPMRETWVQSLGREDPLEKEMAIHSSILAWTIPWTEELGGLQPTGREELDMTSLSLSLTYFRSLLKCFLLRASLVAEMESVCNVTDAGSIPGSGRSPGEGNDYPL